MTFLTGKIIDAGSADNLGIVSYDNPEKQLYFYNEHGTLQNGDTVNFEIQNLQIPYNDNGPQISTVDCGQIKGDSLGPDINAQFRLTGTIKNGGLNPKRVVTDQGEYPYDTAKYNPPIDSTCDCTRFIHNQGTAKNPDWIPYSKDIVENSIS